MMAISGVDDATVHMESVVELVTESAASGYVIAKWADGTVIMRIAVVKINRAMAVFVGNVGIIIQLRFLRMIRRPSRRNSAGFEFGRKILSSNGFEVISPCIMLVDFTTGFSVRWSAS